MYNTNEMESKFNKQKKQIEILRRQKSKVEALNNLSKLIICTLLCIIVIGAGRIISLTHQLNSTNTQNDILVLENSELSKQYDSVATMLVDVSELAVELDSSNDKLKADNYKLNEELEKFKEREELYDKYEYDIERENGSRTDLKYDELKTLEELIEQKGMNQETNDLILSLVMTESNGIEDAKNPKSTATGYGQFLSSTGKFVYNTLMNMDITYVHDTVAKNGKSNLTMMVYYLEHLNDKYNGDMKCIIHEYRGERDEYYKDKVNSFLVNNDLSLDDITIKD